MWGMRPGRKTHQRRRVFLRLISKAFCRHIFNLFIYFYVCLQVLIWSIVTSLQYCLMLSLSTIWGRYTTVQISRVKKKERNKFQLIRSLEEKEFQFNLPEEAASCTSLKHVRVQGFKGLWHRLTASGQGQLLSALVLGVGQGLTCKWWEWQWQLSLIVSHSVWFCKRNERRQKQKGE